MLWCPDTALSHHLVPVTLRGSLRIVDGTGWAVTIAVLEGGLKDVCFPRTPRTGLPSQGPAF